MAKECRCACGYTCGGPGVCELQMEDCIEQHWKRDCDHKFEGWVEVRGGGSTACSICGVTCISHDMRVGP